MNATPPTTTDTPVPPMFNAAPVDDDEGSQWIRQIAAHDQQALVAFYRATIGRVYGLALRITRNSATAEEVAQDVYVQIWRRAASFDAMRGSSMAWTLTICRSRALDALRRTDHAISDPDPTERSDAVLQTGDNPQDLLLATRQNTALHASLQALKPLQRQLLSLAFFADLSHAELAVHTGLALGTVKSTLRRTLAQLREDLSSD